MFEDTKGVVLAYYNIATV